MRVVDESARLAGLWRVSVGLQDGAQAYAYTMWLTVHFAVESRSGAVNGVLLEGPGLDGVSTSEGPKVSSATVEGSLSSRSLRLQVDGWKGRSMLEGQLDRKGSAVATITGFWWSLDANEISGTWSATRLDGAVLEKLIEPKVTGEEPLVTKCTGGCRLTASGLKNKGKPMCSSKHILQSKKSTDDDDELECPGERCGREVNGAHWWCNRCDVAVCSRCEKQTVAKAEDEDERRQFEVAALDRFKLSGKVDRVPPDRGTGVYFEVSCEKVGDGALIGLALQNADDDYSPGEDMGTFALMNNGVCRHNGKDDGKSAAWKDGVTISVAVDCEQGTVQVATVDKPQFEQVLQLAEEEMPKEVGLPLIALLSPGDKGNMMVNVGQQPFKLQPPAKAFRPLAELMELRKQWRVTLPDNVETWPVYVKPSRQAEGAESLQAQWGFEELGTQDEPSGVKWIRHSGGWSPVSLEALGRLCTGLTPLPSTIDALEKRGDANGFLTNLQWGVLQQRRGFKFFRFVVSKARGGDTVNGVSLGQLLLRREGVEIDLAEATAENPDGQFSDTEGPQNAIDGRTSTRWHSTVLSPLVIKMPKPVLIDSFSFRTALSDEQLDPVEWRLEASNDQSTWKVLHSQETSYHPPRRRNGQASWFDTSTRGSGSSGKNKLVPWTSGVKIVAGHWHALTLAVDLPSSKMTIWVDGEVALEICDPSSPLLRCDGPLSLDPQEGLCLFGRKPFLKKEWSWMLGAQIKGLQLQTLAPDLFNTWALQMPLGVWICRAQGTCKTNGLFTRNSASLSSCWRCKSQRVRSAFRPPGDTDPRHPGIKIFTTDSFEEILEKDKKVFLCVSADWCGACQQMKPQWFALAKLLQSSSAVTIGVMNIDENDVDRRYFPEHHIPVVKLLIKTPVTEDSLETNDKPTVISYEGGHHIAGWLEFLGHHTDLNLQDVLDSNYDAYVKEFNIQQMTTDLTVAARRALKEYWGQDSALAGSGAGGWRRLCAFLCNYCWDPATWASDGVGKQEPRPEEAKEVALQKKVSVEAKEPGEDELWIRLLLKRLNEEVEKALRGGHPRKPLDFLLKEVFLPGAKPDDLQDEFTEPRRVRTAELRGGPWSIDLNLHFPTIFPNHLDFKVDRPRSPLDSQMIRAGLHAEERQMAVARGDSGEEKKNAQQQWSAVEQQKAAGASARAEPMALPMLQRSWAKIKQAIDTRAPKRMQTIQELLVRGLDLDFNALGREQASVLWLAAANNDLEVLQFCLAYGADPHRATDGVLPTEAAAATGALQALAMLLRIGAVPGRALHFAAATAQVGALRVLINSKADLQVRVNGLSPLGVAVSRDNDEIIKLLLQQPELASEPLGSVACEQLGLAANANLLYLAAQCGLDRTVDLLIQKGLRANLAAPRCVGSPTIQENVRAVLEPHRWTVLRRVGEGKGEPHVVIKQVMDECGKEDQEKLAAICSGVSAVRPTVLASLLDDAEAIRLLASVETSSDLVPAASPSALMWAQWAGASQAARVMLDAGVTLSNTDLEGLRRLGRARRQSQDGKEDLPSAAGRLLEPGNWAALPKAVQQLAQSTPISRLQDLREKMLLGINDVSEVEEDKVPVLAQLPSQPPLLSRVTSTQVEQEEAAAKEEVAATALLELLGPERTTLMRFLVQREIARGEGKSGLSPNYLLALYASSIYVDIHAQCHRFMLLLKAALNTLPSARGPCYRAILGSEEAPVSSLKHYSPGAVIRWPAGACGTLDFSAAMSALSCGAERSRGVIFKVRRLLTAKEVDETNKQVLFMGGAMRVVGLFPLNGPLMAAERELAAQSKALTQRLGQFCPSLDMVRRPETAQPWDVREQPLVMVLLDEEEES
ncbi:Protein disulfide-isomerase (PDI) (Cellular thyroid hormone-binding protein) (Prolyl 4-hydroxylase subunit beta) [Durusdinium trenchii]|uniref:Protein disulfide-isomerase (PDI) (Cellular thyroid hormone-binding protein) (Prolyl 4-hydroxylase subunit beta) n=1 Tax=Durusdinium trenchii TaxID=1381693 RepID=A0ABP0SEF1_9DINO